jgi:hypothetical protein
MEETLLKIEGAIAGASEESIAEWLERIRHELRLANALRIVEIKLAHEIGDTALNGYIENAGSVVDMH